MTASLSSVLFCFHHSASHCSMPTAPVFCCDCPRNLSQPNKFVPRNCEATCWLLFLLRATTPTSYLSSLSVNVFCNSSCKPIRQVQISGGTPIKMLLLEESRSKKPSVVARLMGLDSIPVQKSVSSRRKVRVDDNYLTNGLKAAFQQLQQQQQRTNEGEYRDVYGVEQQSKNAGLLNSNIDLFFEFLEPQRFVSAPSGTIRITVLKPSVTTGRRPTSIVVLKPTGDLASDQYGYIADDECVDQMPHSPERSVIREARRKQRYLRASRRTLGELLAVSEGSNEEHRQLSLKDKVSSFFFSRSRRTNADSFPMFPEGDHQDKCSSVTIAGRPESVSRSRPIESVARSAAAVIPKESACGGIGVVDRVVEREMAGRQWEEAKWLDLCDFNEEFGGKVLEKLVQDLVFELSCH